MNRIHYIYLIALLLLLGAVVPAHADDGPASEPKIKGNVYGGGQLASVTMNTDVLIKTGTVEGDVYGGGALANVDGNTNVSLIGGTLNSAYGGGLGSKIGVDDATEDVEAIVGGNTTVTLGKLEDKDDPSDPDVYTSSKVLGSIFGANNVNGTPQGHVKVHVLKTTPREGQTSGQYDVAAVYGGGNLAAYVPSDETLADAEKNFAEVLIENCDNSIAYVYGGGNAAPVPATKVTIKGANAIDNAFAGGNGAGTDNPGADIGYLGYYSSGIATEYGTGIATINVQGGTIHHVYGGSNTLGYIKDHAVVNVEAEGSCEMNVAELYGGGKMAPGKAAQINITCTGEGKIDNVYGGAHMADLTGDITLNINGGNIGNAFGGNNESGTIDGAIIVNVDWDEDACGENSLTNVYGGGNLAPYTTPVEKVGPTVNLINGTVSNNVYGGGLGQTAVVTGNPAVNLEGGTILGYVFGGGEEAPVEGNPAVTLKGSTIGTWDAEGNLTSGGDVFAGGNLATVTGNPQVTATEGKANDIFAGGKGEPAVVTGNTLAYVNLTDGKELTICDIYGGGDAANVVGTGNVQLDKGTVRNIYGGGNAANVTNTDVVINGGEAAMAFAGGHGDKTSEPQKEANVTGDAHLTIHGGTVTQAFAGSNSKGTITGSQLVTIVKTGDALAKLHVAEVYSGGNQADGKAGTFDIGCTGDVDEGIGDLFGGAREANITGNIAFTIEGGKIGRIFGGNNVSGNVSGSITVNIAENTTKYDCGLQVGYVYGGGQDAAYTPTTPGAYPAVNISGGTISNDVFGGGLGATAIVTSNPVVNISGGTVQNNVFGGGSLAETDGNPTVNVTDGTVTHDVYGGGALADVTGSTTVNLTGGAVGGAYGGALGQKNGVNGATSDIAAYVNGNTTVTLNGTQVTETGIFGANNLNGTPKGHAFVHVLSTTPRDGQGTEEYDVPAVYGGGNKAAYVPTGENDFAEVLIENCDNSIAYVYGGGNAAPVPATDVKIYGADAIDHAFAGGNGFTEPGQSPNPGADVGYLDYIRDNELKYYGSGKASITVYGGTVHNVYGGSNTLGFIRKSTNVSIAEAPDDDPCDHDCLLNVGNVFGGGNEADIDGNVVITLECTEGAEIIYAGANNANVNGSVTLNLLSGTYDQVYGGNNTGGCVKGKIEVNIDETGCWPIMINELYACGNNAAYSVYGYVEDRDDPNYGKPIESGERIYDDPVLNIYSCTRINNIYGGGKGETATVYGNTHVNINTIKGKFAGMNCTDDSDPEHLAVTPHYIVDENGLQGNSDPYPIDDEVGLLGYVYGGGNAAAVYGNTEVNIGTEIVNKHMEGVNTEWRDYNNKEVSIRIVGDVYGGSKGVLGKPDAALVTGDTKVLVGYEE